MAFKKWLLKVNKLLPPKMMGLIIAILFFVGFAVVFFMRKEPEQSKFYQDIAVYILISWLAILIVYYSWVIGFYNVNYGWTDSDWERWEKRRAHDPNAYDDAPKANPHADETLGLPNGTVRGTIAVSLMVLAVAMMIASLTFSDTYEPPAQFVDNFKFFKDAFLLMIAFYFGNKGLELIKAKQQGQGGTQPTAPQLTPPATTTAPPTVEPAPQPMGDVDNSYSSTPAEEPALPETETTGTASEAQKDFKDPNSVG